MRPALTTQISNLTTKKMKKYTNTGNKDTRSGFLYVVGSRGKKAYISGRFP